MITIAVHPANRVVIGSSVAQTMKMARLPMLLAQEVFNELNIFMLIDKKHSPKNFASNFCLCLRMSHCCCK